MSAPAWELKSGKNRKRLTSKEVSYIRATQDRQATIQRRARYGVPLLRITWRENQEEAPEALAAGSSAAVGTSSFTSVGSTFVRSWANFCSRSF